LTKKELLEMAASVYEEMLAGHSDDEIMDLTGLDPEQFRSVKRFMLEQRGAIERGRSPEERFAQYQIDMARNVRDLDDLVRNLDSKAQYNALVGAIRLRSDIQKGVIEMGQTLGVIPKQAERKEVVAGVLLADLSDKDLRREILKTTSMMDSMITRFGDGDIKALTPGELHFGPALPARPVIEADADEEAPKRRKTRTREKRTTA
jgi:hypothetical protein